MKVPFKKRNNSEIWDQVTWFYDFHLKEGIVEFRDTNVFSAKLKYNGFSRGRSALNIEWECVKTGVRYQSGMKLLDDVLKDNLSTVKIYFEKTKSFIIYGNFTFKKQGTAYLLTNA